MRASALAGGATAVLAAATNVLDRTIGFAAGTIMLMHVTVAVLAAFVQPALVRRGAQEPGKAQREQSERVHGR